MQDSSLKKRTILISLYLILFALTGYFLYKLIAPAPTCTDGKKNQNERGIDCGGQCKPCRSNVENQDLQIKEISFVDGGNGTIDVVAKVANPNYLTGASSFAYEFVLKDAAGSVLASSQGKNFILPAETKYVAEIGMRPNVQGAVASAELEIIQPQWKELTDLGNPQLEINNRRLEKNAAGMGSEFSGVIRNSSAYDLDLVSVIVVVRDQYGKVLGINQTRKEDILAKQERQFLVTWSNNFKAQVGKIEAEAQANVYELINVGNN